MDELEEMLDDDRYDFARGTLEGIYDRIDEMHHVTERMVQAVQNIREAVE